MALTFKELRQYSDRRVFAALAAIVLVALLALAGVLYCLTQVLQLRQESIQITKVQTLLSGYYVQLLNAETGQRGYLLTGNESYLAPYQQAVKELPAEAEQLRRASATYSYAPGVRKALALGEDKMAELGSTLTAYQQQGPEAALAIVATNRGQQDMNQLRSQLSVIGQQQSTELANKRKLATLYGSRADWIGAVTLMLIGVLAALVYYLFLQAIKAERALEGAKDEFVSLASHQLRTPATGIKSILSVLEAEDFGPLNARQRRLVQRARESNNRELRIVEELLEVARADAGQLVLRATKTDVRKVVEAAAQELDRPIQSKRQRLVVEQPDHPVWTWADEEKLYMAISNLVDNASKYTPEGGDIKIRVHNQADATCVEVSDSGVGIETAEIATIFDRFGRARASMNDGIGGTGLGLYLARHITRMHHGDINVESVKGRGSTFRLTLPRSRA